MDEPSYKYYTKEHYYKYRMDDEYEYKSNDYKVKVKY